MLVATYTGEIILLDHQLKQLDSYKSSFNKPNQWIEELKFSPDDKFAAFGAHGGVSPVEVIQVVSDKIKKFAVISSKITSALLHLDWNTDST